MEAWKIFLPFISKEIIKTLQRQIQIYYSYQSAWEKADEIIRLCRT